MRISAQAARNARQPRREGTVASAILPIGRDAAQ